MLFDIQRNCINAFTGKNKKQSPFYEAPKILAVPEEINKVPILRVFIDSVLPVTIIPGDLFYEMNDNYSLVIEKV